MKKFRILVINPGSTSTKLACFDDERSFWEKKISHAPAELARFSRIWEQYPFRKELILSELERNDIDLSTLSAVVGRGGLLRPVEGGTYIINQAVIDDLRRSVGGEHASNLGAVLAYGIARDLGIPSYFVDPITVDEFEPVARFSGHPLIMRKSTFHALNTRAIARKHAESQGKKIEDMNLIIAHLGGGVTVNGLRAGRTIDTNHGLEEGPFTPERSGSLPMLQFAELCFSGNYTIEDIRKMVAGKGGIVSYLGTNDIETVEEMIGAGDEKARLVYEAMAFQIAKEIGARATVLKGEVDGIILTGGMAKSKMMTELIKERVEFIAPVYLYPGEMEMQAMALGALRVLRGEEIPRIYGEPRKVIGVTWWHHLKEYDIVAEEMEKLLSKHGYRFRQKDENIEILYRSCKRDDDKLNKIIDEFVSLPVDIVVAIGSPVAFTIKHRLRGEDIPVVCGPLYDAGIMGIIENESSPEANITAANYKVPVKKQLKNGLLRLLPGVKKLGVYFNSDEIHSKIQLDEVRKIAEELKLTILPFNIDDPEDIAKGIQFFKESKVDAVFCPAITTFSMISNEEMEKLSYQIPTLCALSSSIYKGGLIGVCADWRDLSREFGNTVVRILSGEKPGDIPVIKPENIRLLINEITAKKLGIKISEFMKDEAVIIS